MKRFLILALAILSVAILLGRAEGDQPAEDSGRTATLDAADLREYATLTPEIQHLISRALDLTKQGLTYKYRSDDPKNGGMDCSGTVYFLLVDSGVKDVPRDSGEMYQWVWTKGRFYPVESSKADGFEFEKLKPGDLLFWTGTYDVNRDPPISHVMIYLGVNRHTGRRVMAGASEGRRFNGVLRYGVSVFDFEMPRHEPGDAGTSRFIGYGAIPGLDNVRYPSNN
jgi:peptidoglycan DL-endopeptidase CwlO